MLLSSDQENRLENPSVLPWLTKIWQRLQPRLAIRRRLLSAVYLMYTDSWRFWGKWWVCLLRFPWKCIRPECRRPCRLPINERVSALAAPLACMCVHMYVHRHFGRIVKNKHFQRNPLNGNVAPGVCACANTTPYGSMWLALTYSQEVVVPANLSGDSRQVCQCPNN